MKRGSLEWIKSGLRRGKTQTGLAKALGISPSGVTDLLQGKRRLRADEVDLVAEYLGLNDGVPIIGIAGADPEGAVRFEEAPLGEAPGIPNGTPTTVALEVRGHSMRGIAENNWLVYYDDRRDPPTEDLLGRLCVVGLADGRVLVKTLLHGRKKKHFDLESYAAPTLRDARVEWAAVVTAIVPR